MRNDLPTKSEVEKMRLAYKKFSIKNRVGYMTRKDRHALGLCLKGECDWCEGRRKF
uniref:Uncharacterized protein n=1 Tax=viral metagenome TaxID=1070528 RepID=A0A6M3J4Y7_9ZZZZ